MTKAERYSATFIVVLNCFLCGMVLLVLGNASTVDDLSYIATSDAGFIVFLAIMALFANVALGWMLFRILRRRPPRRSTGPITGE
jgi:hypothetical protein